MTRISLLAAIPLFISFSAVAQSGLTPGLYDYSGTVTVEGTGSQPTPFSGQQCLTAADLADGGQKAFTAGTAANNPCQYTGYSANGGSANWTMTCQAQGYTMSGRGVASYNAAGYSVRSENLSQMMGMNIKTVTVLTGRRTADCTQSTLGSTAAAPQMAAAPVAPAAPAAPVFSAPPSAPAAAPAAVPATGGSSGMADAAFGVGMQAMLLSGAAGTNGENLAQVARAREILQKVTSLGSLTAAMAKAPMPAPRADGQGKFVMPFKRDGNPTDWAGKALQAAAAGVATNMAAEKATEAASSALASVAGPWGGLASSLFGSAAKDKVKEVAQDTGAALAIGGWDSIRASSDQSFDSIDQMIVYMQSSYQARSDYVMAVAATVALYPEIVDRFEPAIKAHYGIH
ncbi:MAG: DUF3617 family protein [Pseudomonadota bacterium]